MSRRLPEPPADKAAKNAVATALDLKIKKLASSYLDSPTPKRAVALALALYPLAFRSAYDIGGTFDSMSRSAKEIIRAAFSVLNEVVSDPAPASYISRLGLMVAAKQRLAANGPKTARHAGRDRDASGAQAASGHVLSHEVRRGVAYLKQAAAHPTSAVAPAITKALDSVCVPASVALRLCIASSLSLSEIEATVIGPNSASKSDLSSLSSLLEDATIAVLEHLGAVTDDA